jgi:hypothetical protein
LEEDPSESLEVHRGMLLVGDAVELPHIWKMENDQQDREMAGENLGCHGPTTGRSAQEV